jgi:hypothetical protein
MKRSAQIVLLVMGTTTVGTTAYSLMPREECSGSPAGVTVSAPAQGRAQPCSAGRSSSSRGSTFHWTRSSSSASGDSRTMSMSESSATSRGGFGSFAHAFTSHFSGS